MPEDALLAAEPLTEDVKGEVRKLESGRASEIDYLLCGEPLGLSLIEDCAMLNDTVLAGMASESMPGMASNYYHVNAVQEKENGLERGDHRGIWLGSQAGQGCSKDTVAAIRRSAW